uniref:Uncharacterized protein n=1 Tax=Avena sativa TaxID=4498 RepID=A0ACD6AI36_AVESA
MSSPASSPDPPDMDDVYSDGPGPASSNLTLLYIIIAVLAGVLLYVAVRYGRSLLSEWRALHGHGTGDGPLPASHLGLSVDDIAALPTFTYRARAAPTPSPQGGWGGKRRSGSSKGRASAAAASVECVVCLQELEDGDVVRVLPACRHFFHGGCIDAWLRAHSSCPVCRAHPEPERARRPGEAAAMSPPLPQLRRCDVSPERPTATRIFADILARSPLRIGGSTSGSKERIVSRSPSPAPMARDYVMSRSPSRTPLTHGVVDERWSQSPQMLEVVVVRSPSPMRFGRQPTTACVGVLERTDASMSASPSPPATYTEDSSSRLSPQVPH